MHVLLYAGGGPMSRKWRWLGKVLERTRERFREHLESRYLGISFVAGIVGIPPVVAMAALATGLGVPARHLLPVLAAGRAVRFTTIAAVGASVWGFLPW